MSGKFDVCALNDGNSLEKNCSHCFDPSSKLKCSDCEMVHYCSEKCQVTVLCFIKGSLLNFLSRRKTSSFMNLNVHWVKN